MRPSPGTVNACILLGAQALLMLCSNLVARSQDLVTPGTINRGIFCELKDIYIDIDISDQIL